MDEGTNKRLGELLRRLARGDVSALDGIARIMERILYSVGNIYYQNRADVEDRIEDLYLLLYKKAGRFRENTNACAWILKLFENSVKSHLKEWRREAEYLKREIAEFASDKGTMDENYLENHLFLREIFDKLTEEERALVIYYHWAKCTVRELAEIMGKSKSAIHKKLEKLEEKIKKF